MKQKELLKYRTEGTIASIIAHVKEIPVDQLISDLYMFTDNSIAYKMTKQFESQIILASTNQPVFEKNLHCFFLRNACEINKNHLYREFYSFFYYIFTQIHKKDKPYHIYCYLDILSQQSTYFCLPPKIVYGIDTKGNLMFKKEPFPNIDIPLINLAKKDFASPRDLIEIIPEFHKYGYAFKTFDDYLFINGNENLILNMVSIMTPFISENTPNIICNDYFMYSNGLPLPSIIISTEMFYEILTTKTYMLPSNGIEVKCKNCGNVSEVFLQDVFFENRFILLYKITTLKGNELAGFFDNKLDLFYSSFLEASKETYRKINYNIENFILELYCMLTTDFDNELTKKSLEHRLIECENIDNCSFPAVTFLYYDKQLTGNGHKRLRHYNKANYEMAITNLSPIKRRLPLGSHASPEAIALAKQFGYIVNEGETFVRPFSKNVYHKKKKDD